MIRSVLIPLVEESFKQKTLDYCLDSGRLALLWLGLRNALNVGHTWIFLSSSFKTDVAGTAGTSVASKIWVLKKLQTNSRTEQRHARLHIYASITVSNIPRPLVSDGFCQTQALAQNRHCREKWKFLVVAQMVLPKRYLYSYRMPLFLRRLRRKNHASCPP